MVPEGGFLLWENVDQYHPTKRKRRKKKPLLVFSYCAVCMHVEIRFEYVGVDRYRVEKDVVA